MCEMVATAAQMAVSRRQLLGGAGLATASAAVATVLGSGTARAASPQGAPSGDPDAAQHRTRLVLLGTAGGPVWWPGSDREGIGSAVVVDGDVYLVDFGDGSGKRFNLWPTSQPRSNRCVPSTRDQGGTDAPGPRSWGWAS